MERDYIEGKEGKELGVYFVTQMIAACFFLIVAAAEMEPYGVDDITRMN